uniref:Uncharacterized protein n=1 Tax=Vitis vinifera TaxID=29760 RepID=A5B8P7_VITVI|nr:hypothetical protein VITISV_025646 [Vitis vinifera]
MDENDDEDEEVYMYPVDMHSNEWDGYQEIVHASNATEWERQQYEIVVGSKRKTGESSCPSGAPAMQKSQKMRKYYGRDIIRPGATRFATNYIALETYFLNPRFQYRPRVGSDPDLIQAVYNVFAKLDPNVESIDQFGNELKLCDMEVENDRVVEKDYLDLLDISVKPIHLDDEVGNLDPRIAAHAREFGVNVERVLSEVHSESFIKDTEDSFQGALDSHQEVDSTSASQNSRPSAIGTFASSYDGSRGGTNDENHGFRRAGPGIEAIGKPYIGKERTMTPYNEELFSENFESMSIGTQFSDSLNEANVYHPYVMGYDQPSSSIDEEYGMLSYPFDAQMSY